MMPRIVLSIKKKNVKKFIDLRTPNYFEGCQGCKKKIAFTDSITINNQKSKCFWTDDNQVIIIVGNRILTVTVLVTAEIKDNLTMEEHVREFISDLVFSEYIPPEGDGETDTEE